MEKTRKVHHEVFDEKDGSQLKEFALDCFDRVLCQKRGQFCNSEWESWETIFPITFPESKLLLSETCLLPIAVTQPQIWKIQRKYNFYSYYCFHNGRVIHIEPMLP